MASHRHRLTVVAAQYRVHIGDRFQHLHSLSSFGLYTSYIIAISDTLNARLTGILGDGPHARVHYGAWRMWRWGAIPVNIYALVWTCYTTVFLPFQTTRPVAGNNTNYALPIYAFVVIAALTWWFLWGKRNWKGLNESAVAYVQKSS